jgi:hypothetical protein
MNSPKMYSILPSLQDSWIGASLNSISSNGNIKMTTSLPSKLWTPPLSYSFTDDKYIILHLNYSKDDMALLGCGVKLINGKQHWKLYKKTNKNPMTKWLEVNSNESISSTLYDKDGVLLGIHSENGQIYKKTSSILGSNWKGPVNFDISMSKIYFDRDGIMIGIGKNDNKLYKKNGYFWNKDKWDKQLINNQKLIDLVLDYDGCFIGLTDNGLVKQQNPGFLSPFKKYDIDFVVKDKQATTFDEIIKSRCGFIPQINNIASEVEHLDDELKQLVNFKKMQKSQCKNRAKLVKNAFGLEYDENSKLFKNIELRNQEISQLNSQINILEDIILQ